MIRLQRKDLSPYLCRDFAVLLPPEHQLQFFAIFVSQVTLVPLRKGQYRLVPKHRQLPVVVRGLDEVHHQRIQHFVRERVLLVEQDADKKGRDARVTASARIRIVIERVRGAVRTASAQASSARRRNACA